ncbi:hypothetical protein FGADI_4557 [Fusarium gaditjirri]|uniref:JmjC domain-containing protein n=1 Tax=Fusarium gaditjirri TaxID=282569 RepID=A0A8H4TCL9_9HYPO|nr:hypothetical protein FGADI_4557 [Fusarium gaditjirri]
MLADHSLLIQSLLRELKELGAEVSSIRADLKAQIVSQSPSTRSIEENHGNQPWTQIQSKLDGVDRFIERLGRIVSGIASNKQIDSSLELEVEPEKAKASSAPQCQSQDVPANINAPLSPDTRFRSPHNSDFDEQDEHTTISHRLALQRQASVDKTQPSNPVSPPDSEGWASGSPAESDDPTHIQDSRMLDTPGSTPPCCPTPHGSTKTTISAEDMMTRLVSKLTELQAKDAPQKMTVPLNDISLAEMQQQIDIHNDGWQYTSIKYKRGPKGKGFLKAHSSCERPVVNWSDFTTTVKRPTLDEASKIFEDVVASPPSSNVPYITGHVKLPSLVPLDPGSRIMNDQALKDLHSEYHHIGFNLSAQRMHCEDRTYREGSVYHGFRSYNEVYAGPGFKLWLVVANHHISKFEDFFEKNFTCGTCNQKYGHESVLFAPSRLKKEEIDFSIEIIGRGEAFRTLPGQPHQIINYGACAARSINYLHDNEEFSPEKAPCCCKCGMSENYGDALVPPPPELVEPARKPLPSKRQYPNLTQSPKATRACTEVLKRLQNDIDRARKVDPRCNIPHLDKACLSPTQVDVLLRAASIRSKVAINQLSSLTRELLHKRQFETQEANQGEATIDRQILYLKEKVGQSILASYLVRHAQFCLAQVVDGQTKSQNRKAASPSDLDRRAKQLGIDNINYHLQEGRNWIIVCGPYEGLHPLILLGSKILGNKLVSSKDGFGVTNKSWHALRNDHLAAFHDLLDDSFAHKLLMAGKLFLDILNRLIQPVTNWEQILSDVISTEDLGESIDLYIAIKSV